MTPALIQQHWETRPTLDAIDRLLQLYRRADASDSPHEQDTCRRLMDDLAGRWRLGTAVLRSYAPASATLTASGDLQLERAVPYWRASIALYAAGFAGFLGRFPWQSCGVDGTTDYCCGLIGTQRGIDLARSYYAACRARS